MQHLSSERLASLDHEPAVSAEMAHLAMCADCRTERDAYKSLAQIAAATVDADSSVNAPRLTNWESLSARLRDEGLLGGEVKREEIAAEHVTEKPKLPNRMITLFMRAAAAIVLVVGGVGVGRITADTSADATVSPSIANNSNATFASNSSGFSSVEEATKVLTVAQQDYERASLWLASNDTTVRSPDVYRARLAALDQMMAASRAALREAPQDPLLNHYYLAAYTAREATLQQLTSSLPVDKTIEGF